MGIARNRGPHRIRKETPRVKYFVSILLLMVALVRATGATFTESFSTEPTFWQTWNPGAFRWDTNAQNLAVTWDSRETNAYFYHMLPTKLTRRDAFGVEFTLRLDDLMLGIDPTMSLTFPICIGFVNLAEAERASYLRGSGVDATHGARSIAEFAYFPDSGFGATVSMALVSSSNQFAYSHSFPVELTLGDIFRVKMSFDPSAQVMSMQLLRNGEPYGEQPDNTIRPLDYPSTFGDFALDAFSITSYNDAGQIPPQYAGSILAHGIVDDIAITWPDPPVTNVQGSFNESKWVVQFTAEAGWNYTLERTFDFQSWDEIVTAPGVDGPMQLIDPDPVADNAFYRISAERP
jgi:hypothetical protein